MRIMVVATSAMFMHIDAQRPIPAAMSASAHMVAAIATASQASMQSCIDIMSMPMVELGIDPIILLIIIVSTVRPPLSWDSQRELRRVTQCLAR